MKEIIILPRHAAQPRRMRLSVILPNLLYKAFYNNVKVDEISPYTRWLKRKFRHLEECFIKTFPELGKLNQLTEELKAQEALTPIPPEKWNELSTQYTERFIVRFIDMIAWCKANDKWAVKSVDNLTSPQAILRYLNFVTDPRGGVPLTHTRDDRLAELREVAKKQENLS